MYTYETPLASRTGTLKSKLLMNWSNTLSLYLRNKSQTHWKAVFSIFQYHVGENSYDNLNSIKKVTSQWWWCWIKNQKDLPSETTFYLLCELHSGITTEAGNQSELGKLWGLTVRVTALSNTCTEKLFKGGRKSQNSMGGDNLLFQTIGSC